MKTLGFLLHKLMLFCYSPLNHKDLKRILNDVLWMTKNKRRHNTKSLNEALEIIKLVIGQKFSLGFSCSGTFGNIRQKSWLGHVMLCSSSAFTICKVNFKSWKWQANCT
ncbi:CLUMA_CG020629, isoform A [Clunio marinus]|uniref:CLUMA_CG020629, isoform A n=1 Tax=Clunio marinus TaxID=568069 RepID=A0A1J1J867_9DIPT|nr:CLUMA_CG020629, isoform A [Clunio marinus]